MSTETTTGPETEGAPTSDGRVGDATRRERIVRLLCAYASESLRSTEKWSSAHAINGTDVRAMAELGQAHRDDCVVTAGQLGDVLGLSSPATSALIGRLERGGHVTRTRDSNDRRRVLLTASASARLEAAEYFQPMGDAVTHALEGCSDADTGVIASFLESLVKHMRGIPPIE